MKRFFAVSSPLFDNFDDMGGGPAPSPAGSDISAPSPSPATPDHNAAPSATPIGGAPAAKPQVPDGYVPSYRIRETREQYERQVQAAQQQWAQREAQYRSEMDAIRKQLHAVIGVQPVNEEQQQIQAIQEQFKKVFPDLAALNERAKDVQALLERSGEFQNVVQYQYQAHGRQALNRLFDMAKTSLGHELSDAAKQRLGTSFVGHLQSDPALLERFGYDPTVVEEFWNDFENNFIGPVRRSQVADVQRAIDTRPPVPRDTPAPIAPIPGPPKAKDLDESTNRAWAAFNAAKQGR